MCPRLITLTKKKKQKKQCLGCLSLDVDLEVSPIPVVGSISSCA